MKVSIIPNDNTVVVDGVAARVDLRHLTHVRAIHWDDVRGVGEVEYQPLFNRRFTTVEGVAEPDRDTTITATAVTDAVAAHAAALAAEAAPDAAETVA